MTEQEILQQMDELQIKLDEMRAGRAAFSVNSSLTEAEKEKQHQEDLQRLTQLTGRLRTRVKHSMTASISSM